MRTEEKTPGEQPAEAGWARIPDDKILQVWRSSKPTELEGDIEVSEVYPDFYEANGVPCDSDGDDMEYSHTVANIGSAPVTVIRKDYSQEDPTVPEPVIIGAIQGEVSEETLSNLWEEWLGELLKTGTAPKADSDFVAWLVETKGHQEAPVPNIATI